MSIHATESPRRRPACRTPEQQAACAAAPVPQGVVPDLRPAFIELYQDQLRGLMLERITAFGGHPIYQTLCVGLAVDADFPVEEAHRHLFPVTRQVYEGARDGR
jgi:hypothetical protein